MLNFCFVYTIARTAIFSHFFVRGVLRVGFRGGGGVFYILCLRCFA